MSNIHREDWYLGVDDEFNVGEPAQKGPPAWLRNSINGPEYFRDRKFQRRSSAGRAGRRRSGRNAKASAHG
ncbi:hypothetical protein PBI_STASIA_74 [Mycobacterium phage Stasia]|uniref:Uncharacterized protein n=1 Tax=Mycobacterium phage Stasia TaxID=1897548 RepID=A0A1D8EUM9_9CAUD|nr:hypothetical protein KIY68_gp19 [Mycobacterium phage Stasia]AOT24730.1 hypothetical protein PBI_STASIA_74 [Mycobacterium phage Stasia]